MKNKRGLRANLLIYEDLINSEQILNNINKLFDNQANDIIQQAKHLSETTTLTFQEALNQIVGEQLNNP